MRGDERERGGGNADREAADEALAVDPDRFGDELAHRALCGRQRRGARLRGARIREPCHRPGGYRRAVAFDVVHAADLEWEEREAPAGEEPRRHAVVTDTARLTQSRARMWRYPARTQGRGCHASQHAAAVGGTQQLERARRRHRERPRCRESDARV